VFGPDPVSSSQLFKKREGFLAPQQFCDREFVRRWIFPRGAELKQFHSTPVTLGDLNAPPLWANTHNLFGVAFSDNDSDEIENPIVGFRLPRQPLKGISVALNLEPVEAAIHDGEINAAEAVTQPQLLKDHRLRIVAVFPVKELPEADPNLSIISGC
jgi:hypothetical protein